MAPSAVPVETVDHLPLELGKKQDGATNGTAHGQLESLQVGDTEKIDLVLRTFRCLIADLCQQFKGGHPGYVDLNGVVETYGENKHSHGL